MKKAILGALAVMVLGTLGVAAIPDTRDEIQWRWAAYKDDIVNYESYLKSWPNGRHSALAREQHDEHSWKSARAANTISAYSAYQTTHPQGRHVREAAAAVSALRMDDALFDAALRTGTEAAVKAFLASYPGHAREEAARGVLRDITEGRDIVDLLEDKRIEVRAQGSGIQAVSVGIRRLVPHPFTVRIPVGTFFVSANPSAQNMVTTAASTIQLLTDEWRSVSAAAACANRPRKIPGGSDTFTVRRSPNQAELAKLMPVLDRAGVDTKTRQAAVWIVTDNADYGDLGILVASRFGMGGSRVINAPEAARAMKICHDAGIDIRRKAIWGDRQTILAGLKDGNLRTWLAEK